MTNDPLTPKRPGWYRDPEGGDGHEAYWDGTRWTGATSPPSRWSRRRRFGVVAGILVGGALLLAAAGCVTGYSCTYDFTYLPALKADPVADLDLPGTRLIRSFNDGEGTVLGKPVHASVERTFHILDQAQAGQILDSAVAFAESNGWQIEAKETLGGETYYSGTKTLGPGPAELGLSLVAEDRLNDPDGAQALRVSMRYGSG